MKTHRKVLVVAILAAILGLLTFSLAFAGESGQNASGVALEYGSQEGVAPSVGGGTLCAGGGGTVGIIHDDGVFENGYSGNSATISNFNVADPFTPVAADYAYTRFCVALVSLGGPNLDFEIVFWDNDGPSGVPGTELAAISVSAAGLPGGLPCAWYEFDLTGEAGLPDGSDGDIYIGVRYSPMAFPSRFTCSDESVTTPIANGRVNFNTGSGWQLINDPTLFPNYRSMSTRVEMQQVVQQAPGIEISKDPASQTVTTGGNADFTITVTNTGDVDLANVNVVDPLVPACANAIVGLTVGASNSYSCTDVGVAASYTNVVTVTSDIVTGGPGATATASALVTTVNPTSVSLSGFSGDSSTFSVVWLVALLVAVAGFGFVLRRKLTA